MKVLTLINGKLKEQEIENTLESLQKIVDGWIEIPFLSERFAEEEIDIVINEEGKLIGLDPQIVVIDKSTFRPVELVVGNCIFVSHDEEGNTVGLTDKQISIVREELRREIVLNNEFVKTLFI